MALFSAAQKRPVASPLRYPGGKASLYARLRSILRGNRFAKAIYVEPYAGGAGAGLALLLTGEVERIAINDLDFAIFAFWKTVIDDPKGFIARIEAADLTIDEWIRQKAIYSRKQPVDLADLGFATFYLNRTNRSGVLNGGPIGGKEQNGPYKIDARFRKATLIERIRLIGLYANQIEVRNSDGVEVIREFVGNPNTLIYADPPYFEKAGSLYMNSFHLSDHAALAEELNESAPYRWVLTYDNVPQVHTLYSKRRSELISLNYSAHRVAKVKEIIVYSDGLLIPESLKMTTSP